MQCIYEGVVGNSLPRLGEGTHSSFCHFSSRINDMAWTKPEAEVVAVTMEVTAYVATL
jgi:hypothetical protein